MAVDDGPSKIADIAQRLHVDGNYANKYRARLLRADMIVGVGHGRIDYKLPYFRDYLRSDTLVRDDPQFAQEVADSAGQRILDE